ncbi:hypothetical protein Glove_227g173 [Diversispora epigaea]|uniref:HAT C-terminal dimerisation domain-containing protein n=1 Tax=Diversispora epigaea TaxID=1348612 RepID=A0A397IEK1_9GLOM|nr:hypothetical protein Glove_227g173 [Diversispora epigaea]
MDETSDDCARSVVNTLFVFRTHTKLVSVDFLEQVNNSTIGQTLLPILTFYNIPLNLPRLFLSDSAAYMKKCYRDVLKSIMPQLIHLPCIAHILNLIGETWRDFPQFSLLKTFLAKIKDSFVKSPARKARYITHLRMNGVASPCKIPLPNKTRWNSWFKMVFYTKEHLQYWLDFYKMESESDPRNETISSIYSILQNTHQFGLITVYLHFISIYAKAFVHDLDFFQQQKKPVFPFVETRLVNLMAYLESNRTAIHFDIFQVAYKKFEAHIPNHPTRPLFRAVRLFDPKYMHTGNNNQRHSIYQYTIIDEFNNPSDDLLHEWGIYCGLEFDENIEENNLDKYWNNLATQLPILSKISLEFIWLPVSSCAVERSFSLYNTLLDNDRQNLSKESLKQLNMMYFNRDN